MSKKTWPAQEDVEFGILRGTSPGEGVEAVLLAM
jgi:hypothetical protein